MKVDLEAFIEFHDGSIERYGVTNRSVLVCFDHLAVYRREDGARYGVWSYRAELAIEDVAEVSFVGPLTDDSGDGFVNDLELTSPDGALIDSSRLLEEAPVVIGTLVWTTFACFRAELRGGRVSLRLLETTGRFESFHP